MSHYLEKGRELADSIVDKNWWVEKKEKPNDPSTVNCGVPWEDSGDTEDWVEVYTGDNGKVAEAHFRSDKEIARYIAHFDPKSISALLDRAQRAEDLEFYIRQLRGYYSEDIFPPEGTSTDAASAKFARNILDSVLWYSEQVEEEKD